MHRQQEAFKNADLILRHLKGELNSEENKCFEEWLNADIKNHQFLESIKNESALSGHLEFFSSLDKESAWNKLVSSRKSKSIFRLSNAWKYAAAILVISMSAGILLYLKNERPLLAVNKSDNKYQDINPGGEKATLTLADGSVIELDAQGSGIISETPGLRISKNNGRLIYEISDAGSAESATFNIITTPRGGQYQVVLPDGSIVWLNASSSLSFPTSFSGNERLVRLSGEAYFEVSKDRKKAFRVAANNAEVKVLGTHFNINAYPDESQTSTTLIEGSVQVIKGSNALLISPGQQAKTTHSGEKITVSEADIEEAVAWKNGVFLFNNEDIPMVMRQLGRWYNIEVVYKGEIPDIHFTGKISKNYKISKILNLLELTGGVHFTIEDKKILVYR